ncbi:MAG: tetratricopeptide repeat protein [Pseudonocardiales bacterium]|nr:tetratricopeptide repeat protein [Pseudonocardiales bacterium]
MMTSLARSLAKADVFGDDGLVTWLRWWVPSASCLTTVAVGLLTWLATSSTGIAQVGAAAGAAIVTVGGPSLVGWLQKRVLTKERATAVRELQPADSSAAGLLRADRHIVPFTGRNNELAELLAWCRDRDRKPVRLVVGAGGVGKTRLALELGKRLEGTKTGWQVAVVAAGQEADAFTILHDAISRSSIFLIVDYAETRSGLVDLLRSVAGSSAHVRVLLIARSAGGWWEQLGSGERAVQNLIGEYLPLSTWMDPEISNTQLINEAMRSFAKALGVPVPTKAPAAPPASEVPVLELHTAALLAVLQSRAVMPDIDLLNELLRHERRSWAHSAGQMGLDLDPVVLQRAVAVACLFGAVDESDGATVLCRVPDLRDDENRRRRNVARWLHELYPGGSGYWGVLQPELVAETLVIGQLTECPELVMAELSELRIEQLHRMLRVLSMGTTRQPGGAEQLKQVLRADLGLLVYPALKVTEVTGGKVGAVLARVLSDAPVTLETLRTIEKVIPYPTTALAETAVVVTRRILHMLPPDAPLAERAHWHLELGVVLAQAGRVNEARFPTETAVEYYRILVGTDRSRYLPDLARALHNLGIRHADQGRYDDALDDTGEAVEYYQELVAHNPVHYRAGLAAALSKLGLWLVKQYHHADALAPLDEAVQHYWELAEADNRYRQDLVQTSSDLRWSKSQALRDIGMLETAVERARALVESDDDRELARSLCNLGNGYRERNRHEEARHCFGEALDYYRTMTESLNRYQPELAACLNDLSDTLTALEDYDRALFYAREAVAVHRNLARCRPGLARALHNHAVCLASMGRHEQALPHAQKAVKLYRHLAEIDPGHYQPELARALSKRGESRSELGDRDEALSDFREAVDLILGFYQDRPSEILNSAGSSLARTRGGLQGTEPTSRSRPLPPGG